MTLGTNAKLVGLCVLFGLAGGIIYLYLNSEDDLDELSVERKRFTHMKRTKVRKEHVGALLGRERNNIRQIEKKSNTSIDIKDLKEGAAFRDCIIRGSKESCEIAYLLILQYLAELDTEKTEVILIPVNYIGQVIGKCGERLHAIAMSSGAKINVAKYMNSGDESSKRNVTIKGNEKQIELAKYFIKKVLDDCEKMKERIDSELAKREPRGKPRNISPVKSNDNLSVETTTEKLEISSDSNERLEVYVSAVTDPSQFWVQIVGSQATELDQLVEAMTEYYSDEKNREIHKINSLNVGDIVATIFIHDGKWYRAEVRGFEDVEGMTCAEVFYLDYGDTGLLPTTEIYELRTDFLRLRFQAIECYLAGIQPLSKNWSEEAVDEFEKLAQVAQWKKMLAHISGYKERQKSESSRTKREGSPIPGVDLYDVSNKEDKNIASELIKLGLALSEKSAELKCSNTGRVSSRKRKVSPSSTRNVQAACENLSGIASDYSSNASGKFLNGSSDSDNPNKISSLINREVLDNDSEVIKTLEMNGNIHS